MSEQRDPLRLIELGDPAFTELEPGVRDARRQGPSAEQLARMRSALGLPPPSGPADGGASGPAGADAPRSTPSSTPAGAAGSPLLRLVVSGGLVIAAAFGIQRALDGGSSPAPRVGQPPTSSLPPASSPAAGGSVAVEPAGQQEPALRDPEPQALPRRPRAPAIERVPVEPRLETAVQDPGAELALLKRARAHARSAPARALELLKQHEQHFARGVLEQEREVIAVEALLAAGQREQAARRAARFRERFPASAHLRRIQALLSEQARVDSNTKQTELPHSMD